MYGWEQARLKLASPYAREYAPDGLASPPLRSAASAGAARGGVAGRASMSDAGADAALEPAQGAGGCSISCRPATAVRPPASARWRPLSRYSSTRRLVHTQLAKVGPCRPYVGSWPAARYRAVLLSSAASAVLKRTASPGLTLRGCADAHRAAARSRLPSHAEQRRWAAAPPARRAPQVVAAPARPLGQRRDRTPSLHARSALWPHRQQAPTLAPAAGLQLA